MKSPLRYQVTQFDCGPTTMTNAIMFLFEREEIPPDLVSHIGQCTLDSYDPSGHCGMYGTSGAAIRYFGSWLNELRYAGLLPIRSQYVEGEKVYFGGESRLSASLRQGAAVVLHVFCEVGHYILITGETSEGVLAFDPYFRGNDIGRTCVTSVTDQPFSYNRIIPREVLHEKTRNFYSMGETASREAIILQRDGTENLFII